MNFIQLTVVQLNSLVCGLGCHLQEYRSSSHLSFFQDLCTLKQISFNFLHNWIMRIFAQKGFSSNKNNVFDAVFNKYGELFNKNNSNDSFIMQTCRCVPRFVNKRHFKDFTFSFVLLFLI